MKKTASNPSHIAREVLLRLASNKIAPTPVNYRQFYDEIAGTTNMDETGEDFPELKIFSKLVSELPCESEKSASVIHELQQSLSRKDWGQFKHTLTGLLVKGVAARTDIPAAIQPAPVSASQPPDEEPAPEWAELISTLVKQLENRQTAFTSARKREGLNRVLLRFGADPAELYLKLQALITIWSTPPLSGSGNQTAIEVADSFTVRPSGPGRVLVPDTAPGMDPILPGLTSDEIHTTDKTSSLQAETDLLLVAGAADHPASRLRDLLAQALESGVADHLPDAADLAEETRMIARQVRNLSGNQALPRIAARLKTLYHKLALRNEDRFKMQQGLIRLFHLLMDNVSELTTDNQWLNAQIAMIKELLSTAPDLQAISRAERGLRDTIIKNSIIKTDLENARTIIRTMVSGLISNIQGLSETTGNYNQKVEGYLDQISNIQSQEDLSALMTILVQETRNLQAATINSHNDLIIAQSAAKSAEDRINRLEAELREMSDKAREDQLTGILNRRGLERAFERAVLQTEQRNSPLCVCMIDIDNFKQINDTYGHQTGDEAIIFLVKVIQETVRPTDIIARYGGEEFLLLLPDAGMNDAVNVATRIQHNLSKRFFMGGDARMQITFSAGVTVRRTGETMNDIVTRADKALYGAKHAGKNRIFTAELVTR